MTGSLRKYLYISVFVEIFSYSTFVEAKDNVHKRAIQMKIGPWIPLPYSCRKNNCPLASKEKLNINQNNYNFNNTFSEENIQPQSGSYPDIGLNYRNNQDYPWGPTAPFQKHDKLCVSYQYATNEMGYLVRYEKVRPAIYCDNINR